MRARDSARLPSRHRPAPEARSLYLPIHGRFYLVAASLTCRLPGFPDRVVRAADGESSFFVLRRLVDNPDDGWAEQGWVQDGPHKGWHTLPGDPTALLPCELGHEERLPLFAVPSCPERSLLAGYLATSSRETYAVPAHQVLPDPDDVKWQTNFRDARIEELKAAFFDQIAVINRQKKADTPTLRLSVYLLLGLWEFLAEHIEVVAAALREETTRSLSGSERELVGALAEVALSPNLSLAEALTAVSQRQDRLNYLGDGPLPSVFQSTNGFDLTTRTIDANKVYEAVFNVLPAGDARMVNLPKFAEDGADIFVVRCVYERPQCEPCQQWVSWPSIPFRIAPLYDPDAPARNIQLALPMDLSMSGLRRLKKSVSVRMSPELQRKLGAVDLFDPSPGGDALGVAMICTFSIPIITLCAFVLLMALVFALNIVFWWLPFFRICEPVRR